MYPSEDEGLSLPLEEVCLDSLEEADCFTGSADSLEVILLTCVDLSMPTGLSFLKERVRSARGDEGSFLCWWADTILCWLSWLDTGGWNPEKSRLCEEMNSPLSTGLVNTRHWGRMTIWHLEERRGGSLHLLALSAPGARGV